MKMANVPMETRVAIAKKASVAALAALRKRSDPYHSQYGIAFKNLLHLGAAVKQRCTNPNCIGFSNYGGRGIQFGFPSVRAFAEWVADNLGPKSSADLSIDRIDNAKGYEPGNLRWATRAEQARNKRAYRRTKNGERIRTLKAQRPDLTYETLRLWVCSGLSNEEILSRGKYVRTCV
jgi:hypothetical protein